MIISDNHTDWNNTLFTQINLINYVKCVWFKIFSQNKLIIFNDLLSETDKFEHVIKLCKKTFNGQPILLFINSHSATTYQSLINSLWPSDAIRWQGTESTLAQLTVAWQHQTITWTNVDISPVRSCGIHHRALSWEDLKISISKIRWKITSLESNSDLPGANELSYQGPVTHIYISELGH